MATNIRHTANGNVKLALAVAAGLVSGDLARLGTAGLIGILHTNRATTATINAGTADAGLANGEATVELVGISTVVDLAITGAVAQFAKVYRAVDGDGVATYVTDPAGNEFVGYAIEALSGAGTAKVAIAARAGGEIIVPIFQATPGDAPVFVAPRALRLKRLDENHGTAGSDGSAVTLMPKKCTGTQAPSAGAALLSAALDMKGTANTVQNGALSSTAADLAFAAGDRFALDYTGTLTALANVAITAVFEAI